MTDYADRAAAMAEGAPENVRDRARGHSADLHTNH